MIETFPHYLGPLAAHGRLFIPRGPILAPRIAGAIRTRSNPRVRPSLYSDRMSLAARLIVGFDVAGQRPITVETLMAMVEYIQRQEKRNASSSFVAQQGIWQQNAGDSSVFEDSAQVILLDASSTPGRTDAERLRAWELMVVDLAEAIATCARQQYVLVEGYRNGIASAAVLIDGDPSRWSELPPLAKFRAMGTTMRRALLAQRGGESEKSTKARPSVREATAKRPTKRRT